MADTYIESLGLQSDEYFENNIESLGFQVVDLWDYAILTTDDYVQYNDALGFFLGENYEIQPLPQTDAEIQAATGWTTSTVFTFDELVAEAAASPASGNYGHIELSYYNNAPTSHNIAFIEVELADGVTKRIYCFNYM